MTSKVKCSQLLRIIKKDCWYVGSQKGSHMKMIHPTKSGHVIFPNHGSQEMGKSLQHKILKDAGIKL